MTTQRLGWLAASGIALTVAVGACIPTGAGVPAGTPGTSSSAQRGRHLRLAIALRPLRQTVVRLSEPDAAADLPRLHRPPGRHPDLDRSRAGHDRAQHRVLEPAALPVARPRFAALRAEPDRGRLGARAGPGCRARPRGPAGTVAVGLGLAVSSWVDLPGGVRLASHPPASASRNGNTYSFDVIPRNPRTVITTSKREEPEQHQPILHVVAELAQPRSMTRAERPQVHRVDRVLRPGDRVDDGRHDDRRRAPRTRQEPGRPGRPVEATDALSIDGGLEIGGERRQEAEGQVDAEGELLRHAQGV